MFFCRKLNSVTEKVTTTNNVIERTGDYNPRSSIMSFCVVGDTEI